MNLVVVDVVIVSAAVVGWFVCVGGRGRDAQPKYAPDLILEIHGVRLLWTGRLVVGMATV